MHRHQRPLWGAPLRMATCLALAGAAMAAHAQPPDTLAQAFEQAWATQPLPQALSARRSALAASRQAADAWTAQPAALELRTKTDRPGTDRGAQELEVGVALPLWLPGQRSRSQALVTQEEQALDARLDSARLQLAGQVREAWWAWQRARAELALAGAQVEHAQALSQDVHRRARRPGAPTPPGGAPPTSKPPRPARRPSWPTRNRAPPPSCCWAPCTAVTSAASPGNASSPSACGCHGASRPRSAPWRHARTPTPPS